MTVSFRFTIQPVPPPKYRLSDNMPTHRVNDEVSGYAIFFSDEAGCVSYAASLNHHNLDRAAREGFAKLPADVSELSQASVAADFWTAAGASLAKWVESVVGALPSDQRGGVRLVTYKDRPFYYELVLGRDKLSAFEVTVLAKPVSVY